MSKAKTQPRRVARKSRPGNPSIVLEVNGDRWAFVFDDNEQCTGIGFAIAPARQIILGHDVMDAAGNVYMEGENLACAVGHAVRTSLKK